MAVKGIYIRSPLHNRITFFEPKNRLQFLKKMLPAE